MSLRISTCHFASLSDTVGQHHPGDRTIALHDSTALVTSNYGGKLPCARLTQRWIVKNMHVTSKTKYSEEVLLLEAHSIPRTNRKIPSTFNILSLG